MEWYLPVIWAGLIGTAVAMYVILDGFDLGLGILFPFARNESQRDQMMRSIAPFWDGNETWLVLGGGGLWVAFPVAYAVIMPAMYLPVIVMLLALVFRGVAFEFRIVSESKPLWNFAFTFGSLLAAFSQGIILGGLIQGIKVENGQFAGGHFDWATPFCDPVRPRAGRGLCAARRDLADHEDRGRGGRTRARSGEDAAARRARLHGGGVALYALRDRAHRQSLVLAAEFLLSVAGAAGDRAGGVPAVALDRQGARLPCRSSPASGFFCSAISG